MKVWVLSALEYSHSAYNQVGDWNIKGVYKNQELAEKAGTLLDTDDYCVEGIEVIEK